MAASIIGPQCLSWSFCFAMRFAGGDSQVQVAGRSQQLLTRFHAAGGNSDAATLTSQPRDVCERAACRCQPNTSSGGVLPSDGHGCCASCFQLDRIYFTKPPLCSAILTTWRTAKVQMEDSCQSLGSCQGQCKVSPN